MDFSWYYKIIQQTSCYMWSNSLLGNLFKSETANILFNLKPHLKNSCLFSSKNAYNIFAPCTAKIA